LIKKVIRNTNFWNNTKVFICLSCKTDFIVTYTNAWKPIFEGSGYEFCQKWSAPPSLWHAIQLFIFVKEARDGFHSIINIILEIKAIIYMKNFFLPHTRSLKKMKNKQLCMIKPPFCICWWKGPTLRGLRILKALLHSMILWNADWILNYV
jgi:hypothetical protein